MNERSESPVGWSKTQQKKPSLGEGGSPCHVTKKESEKGAFAKREVVIWSQEPEKIAQEGIQAGLVNRNGKRGSERGRALSLGPLWEEEYYDEETLEAVR